MKIHNLISGPHTAIDRPAAGTAKAAATPAEAGNIRISDLSVRLHRLEAEVSVEQPFDAGKVEAIKQAMRNGEFKVNAEVVADRLIDSLKDLLARPN